MQNYSTIIGVISLRENSVGYRTVQSRYNIGNGAVSLIMNRYKELGIPLKELIAMQPKKVEETFYPPENLRHTVRKNSLISLKSTKR